MAKKIVRVILWAVIIVGVISLIYFSLTPGNALNDWWTNIFAKEQGDDQSGSNNNDTNNTTSDDKSGDTNGSSVNVTIEDMTAAERLEAILEIREQINARTDSDREFNLQEAMIMSMHIKVDKDGKYLENGHNMPAPGVTTYPMDEFPGGWTWADDETKADDGTIKVPMFICGDKITIYQTKLGNTEFKAADVDNLEIMLCNHADGLLSPSWERNLGEIAIVKFDEAGATAFENVFRWWWEVDENGDKIAAVGFTYCNDAPEGVEIVPVIVPTVDKSTEK